MRKTRETENSYMKIKELVPVPFNRKIKISSTNGTETTG